MAQSLSEKLLSKLSPQPRINLTSGGQTVERKRIINTKKAMNFKGHGLLNNCFTCFWLRGQDLNLRLSGYEPNQFSVISVAAFSASYVYI